jgi:hypothetical protein
LNIILCVLLAIEKLQLKAKLTLSHASTAASSRLTLYVSQSGPRRKMNVRGALKESTSMPSFGYRSGTIV